VRRKLFRGVTSMAKNETVKGPTSGGLFESPHPSPHFAHQV